GKAYSFRTYYLAFVNRKRFSGAVDEVTGRLPFTLQGTWEKAGNLDVVLSSSDFSLIGTKQKYLFAANNLNPSPWRMEQYETVHPPNSHLVLCRVQNLDQVVAQEVKDSDSTNLMCAKKMSVLSELEAACEDLTACEDLMCVNAMIQPKKRNKASCEDLTADLDSFVEEIERDLMCVNACEEDSTACKDASTDLDSFVEELERDLMCVNACEEDSTACEDASTDLDSFVEELERDLMCVNACEEDSTACEEDSTACEDASTDLDSFVEEIERDLAEEVIKEKVHSSLTKYGWPSTYLPY
ncbi:NAC domain-containing protein 83-like protein, partial [Tanacetum coccineum]